MPQIEKNLKEWVAQGFIDQQQANRIQEYEANRPGSSWFLSGLLILGVIIIGIGIISLVAANWQQIPNPIKLIADFIILMLVAALAFFAYETKREITFEILLLFFNIFCLASIGLISQVYNTGGELYQALMLWSVITAGTVILSYYGVVPFIWLGGFLIGVVWTVIDSSFWQPIFYKNVQAIAMTVPFLCFSLAWITQKIAPEKAATRAFQIWIFIAGLIVIIFTEIAFLPSESLAGGFKPYLIGDLFALLTILVIIQDRNYSLIQKMLVFFSIISFLILCHLSVLQVELNVIYAFFAILILGFIALFMASMQRLRLFQWLLFLIGVRFLILYFQALGGLTRTGFGLILSGILIIVMAILWNKYRVRLAKWAERLTQ